MIVIALSGKMESGKDTHLEAIEEHMGASKVRRVAFADPLKKELAICYANALSIPSKTFWQRGDRELIQKFDNFVKWLAEDMGHGDAAESLALTMLGLVDAYDKNGWPELNSARPDPIEREALKFISEMHHREYKRRWRVGAQMWGTELRRFMSDTYWVDKMQRLLRWIGENCPEVILVYITDTRFPNEADYCVSMGYYLLRLERPKHVTQNADHPSETALDNYHGFNEVLFNTGTVEHFIHQSIDWLQGFLENVLRNEHS